MVPATGETWDVRAIEEILPHRYPFLLIDRVLELVPGERILALKNVTANEPFFPGHFPGRPVMPGVLIVEAMAQAGGVLLLGGSSEPSQKLAFFTAIDGARFRRPVVPGDQLHLTVTVLRARSTTAKMRGEARVGDELAAEAELMAALVDR